MSSYSKQMTVDFPFRISQGDMGGFASVFKFSRSAAITSSESVIWDGGGDYPWLTAAETMSVVSDDADDNGTGAGARTLYIEGLDSDFNVLSEVITLNGLTPVVTTGEFLRVYRAAVLTSGTDSAVSDANQGDITITGSTSTNLVAKVLATNGQTLMSAYTVPAGKTAYITGASFSAGQGKQVTFKGKYRNATQAGNGAFSVKYVVDIYESSFSDKFFTPLQIPEKTDMCFTAVTSVGTIDASASFGIVLVDNV